MAEPYEIRGVVLHSARVRVHWSDRKGIWCIRSGGYPMVYAPRWVMRDVKFTVHEYGRQKSLRGSRQTHAFIDGAAVEYDPPTDAMSEVVYQEQIACHFYVKDTGQRVDRADLVVLLEDGRIFIQ